MSSTSQAAEFRQLLERGDVDGLVAAWSTIAPHLPTPPNRELAEVVMHRARTETASLPLRARAHSHAWLRDHGWPSGLPDALRPKAERLYPRIAAAVGISVNTRSEILKPAMPRVRQAMGDAVEELHADGVQLDAPQNQSLIRGRMREAGNREMQRLFGRALTQIQRS